MPPKIPTYLFLNFRCWQVDEADLVGDKVVDVGESKVHKRQTAQQNGKSNDEGDGGFGVHVREKGNMIKDDVPIYMNVMAETEDEMKHIAWDKKQLYIYIAKILIHTWENNCKIDLRYQVEEISRELLLSPILGMGNKVHGFLLPHLMLFVSQYKLQGSSHNFQHQLSITANGIMIDGFDNNCYVWILELLKELGHQIYLHEVSGLVLFPKCGEIIRMLYTCDTVDSPSLLKLRLVQLVNAILLHRDKPCADMIRILREIIITDNKQENSIGLLHVAVWALPLGKSDVMKLFLQLGASVNRLDEFGATPLYHLSELCGYPHMELFRDLPNKQILLDKVREKTFEAFDLLVRYGAHPDYCSSEGLSALDIFQTNMFDMCAVKPQTLRCLAAREVNRLASFDVGDIPANLKEFVRRHNPIFREAVKIRNVVTSNDIAIHMPKAYFGP